MSWKNNNRLSTLTWAGGILYSAHATQSAPISNTQGEGATTVQLLNAISQGRAGSGFTYRYDGQRARLVAAMAGPIMWYHFGARGSDVTTGTDNSACITHKGVWASLIVSQGRTPQATLTPQGDADYVVDLVPGGGWTPLDYELPFGSNCYLGMRSVMVEARCSAVDGAAFLPVNATIPLAALVAQVQVILL